MTVGILIQIYFGLSLFIAGYYLGDEYDWAKTKTDKIVCLLICLFFSVFGVVYFTIAATWIGIKISYKVIDGYFQTSFFITYLFTKKWHNLPKENLLRINNISVNRRNTDKLKDRIYRYGTKLINKRNNYIYVPDNIES